MMKHNLLIIFVLLATTIYPATSISRWFSSSYADLTATLRRYGHCVGDLTPLKDNRFNETDYLIHQMKLFLDEAKYDIEQLANITILMDTICRPDTDAYAISVNIDVDKYNSSNVGKQYRCRAIDEALDAMYGVFKRAAYNKSEPLDFSTIQFYPTTTTTTNRSSIAASSYNLTDLINTSWIKSETQLEHVCKITDSIKDYVREHTVNSTAQDRVEKQQVGFSNAPFRSLLNLVDRLILEPFFGLQRRIYWESTNTYEFVYSGISNQLDNFGKGFGSRLRSTRNRLSSLLSSSSNNTSIVGGKNNVNNTTMAKLNSTTSPTSTTTTTRPTDAPAPLSQTTTSSIISPTTITTNSVSMSSMTTPTTTAKVNSSIAGYNNLPSIPSAR